jgi:hypothetical protein
VAQRSVDKPILFVDVDGVLSLFGFAPDADHLPGPFHWIDGVAHCIPEACGPRLARLGERFELVWATGWEDKANDYLPFLLKLPVRELPVLWFGDAAVFGTAHWKLGAIDRYAGDRPAAWIDDSLDERCEAWARERTAPTLLVRTESAVGLSDEHVERLVAWADEVAPAATEAANGTGEAA